MESTLDSLVWIDKSEFTYDELVDLKFNRLTLVSSDDYSSKEIELYSEIGEHSRIPRHYYLSRFGKPTHSETVFPLVANFPKFAGTLREGQRIGTKTFLDKLSAEAPYGGILQAKCGAGKTISSLYLASKIKTRTCVLVHKKDLLDQWVVAIQKFLPSAQIGTIQGKNNSFKNCDIVVATFQSIQSKFNVLFDANFFWYFGTIIIDECFIAGTLVDGKPIEEYKVGDLVRSVNHTTGKVELKPVIKLKKTPCRSSLLKIKVNGKEIVCTEKHPFYVKDIGYIPAHQLTTDMEVYCETSQSQQSSLQELRDDSSMSRRERQPQTSIQTQESVSERSGVLLYRMSERMEIEEGQSNDGKDKQNLCLGSNENEQSIISSRSKSKDLEDSKADGTQTSNTRGQRNRADETTRALTSSTRGWLDGRAHHPEKRLPTFRLSKRSNTLQDRSSECGTEDSIGSGRTQSRIFEETGTRSEERAYFGFYRVDSISNIQHGSSKGDGHVYNLEVKDNHNYFAEDVLVHNCHHIGAKTFTEVMTYFPAKIRIGLTATPRRKDGMERVFEHNIGPILAKMAGQTLTGNYTQTLYESNINMKKYKLYGGKGKVSISKLITGISEDQLRNHYILEVLEVAFGKGRKVLLLSNRKNQLIELHKAWQEKHGDTSGLYMGGMKASQQRASSQKQVIFGTAQIFAEGTDIPALDTLCLISPMSDIEQAIGRIQRLYDGKKAPFVWDLVDNNSVCLAMAKKRQKHLEQTGFKQSK